LNWRNLQNGDKAKLTSPHIKTRRIQMDRDQIELVGAAYLAGHQANTLNGSRIAPGYERPRMVHKIPRGTFRLEGERCKPKMVQKFDGKPLYWVLDQTALEGGEASVFISPDSAKAFRESLPKVLEEAPLNKNLVNESTQLSAGIVLGGEVILYEDANRRGAAWKFYPSWGNIPDFTRVYPTLWWTTNINDRVSSIYTSITSNTSTPAWTILHEHINFEGSQFWIEESYGLGFVEKDLDFWGWNDRASSMSYEVQLLPV
jgi:hypothetical protein